jgi:hypothetical protein
MQENTSFRKLCGGTMTVELRSYSRARCPKANGLRISACALKHPKRCRRLAGCLPSDPRVLQYVANSGVFANLLGAFMGELIVSETDLVCINVFCIDGGIRSQALIELFVKFLLKDPTWQCVE